MTDTRRHPPVAELADFLHGRLSDDAQAAVERHVADCGTCALVMNRLADCALAHLARDAVKRPTVADPTPPPGSLRYRSPGKPAGE